MQDKLTILKCSKCGSEYALESSSYRPFCSERCQQVDLRNWLTESYGLPFESNERIFNGEFDEDEEFEE
jgi:endogenous inhibitor of DNA gyrase (YacG/DUF329 family)